MNALTDFLLLYGRLRSECPLERIGKMCFRECVVPLLGPHHDVANPQMSARTQLLDTISALRWKDPQHS